MTSDYYGSIAGEIADDGAMAEASGIPRWLELQAEIDYRYFLLNEMRRQLEAEDGRLTPLDRLIDEATGLDGARLAEASEIIAESAATEGAADD